MAVLDNLGRWSRISRQMAKNLLVFLADHLEISAKLAKNLSVFMVNGPDFVSEWPRISWHFGQIAQPALLVQLKLQISWNCWQMTIKIYWHV